MSWPGTCSLLAALLVSVYSDGTHYRDGERVLQLVMCVGELATIVFIFRVDYGVCEQGGSVFQPSRNLPLLLTACL